MPDIMIDRLSADTMKRLQELATARHVNLEDYVRNILNAVLGLNEFGSKSLVSKEYFRDNFQAVLDAAENTPVVVFDESGKEYVIMSQKEFDRLGKYFDRSCGR